MSAIAIMCSGGDSSGMNPAIKKFVDYAYEIGLTPYLIYDGFEGLIDGNIKQASHENVAGIIHLGGTVIRTSRSKRFFEKEYREIGFQNLQKYGIDKLVVLGGDGSFRGMDIFCKEFNISFIGIPSTIDNDIAGTEYCLGVDTALNVIKNALDDIRDTGSSFKRAFVIETMGRGCGYLALISALTSGAEICLIPEIEYDLDSLKVKLQGQIKNGRTYIIAIVSEALKNTDMLQKWIESELEFETRVMVLGHIQRGGSPSVYDRLMAFEFISLSIDKLLQGKCNEVIVYNGGEFSFKTINEVVQGKYTIKPELLKLASRLSK